MHVHWQDPQRFLNVPFKAACLTGEQAVLECTQAGAAAEAYHQVQDFTGDATEAHEKPVLVVQTH